MSVLLSRLHRARKLTFSDWCRLLEEVDTDTFHEAAELARSISLERFGTGVYVRGIIECTNRCVNPCAYCGLNRDNRALPRYQLSREAILAAAADGAGQGICTLVLQGGEGVLPLSFLLALLDDIRTAFPNMAVTLSFGEMDRRSYQKLHDAGATRYLLRHEAANPLLYRRLHGNEQSFWHRITALYTLKEIGYQTGCGMMVGVPGQTTDDLAHDLCFIQEFAPAMLGIGPFLPHRATRFAGEPPGSARMTLFLMSLSRILFPDLLLPATTALRTLEENGLQKGVLHGCNVVMPSMTPPREKAHYTLYDTCGTRTTGPYAREAHEEQAHEEHLSGQAIDEAGIREAIAGEAKNDDAIIGDALRKGEETSGGISAKLEAFSRELAEIGYSLRPGRGDAKGYGPQEDAT